MQDAEQAITIPVEADVSKFEDALKDIEKQSKQFGKTFVDAVKSVVVEGKTLESALDTIALKLSDMALSAALKPLEQGAADVFSNLMSSLVGAGQPGAITPFAQGGIVSSPTLFSAGGGTGLMGEAGAEAILPLARGGDGRLGVRSYAQEQSVNIVFNVTTPDASGFRKSETQISTMLARAVGRGRRNF